MDLGSRKIRIFEGQMLPKMEQTILLRWQAPWAQKVCRNTYVGVIMKALCTQGRELDQRVLEL